MTNKQKTIQNSVSISGKGLHSGLDVTMTFHPAEENHGIKFQRVDIDEKPLINADANLVTDTSRGTTLTQKGHTVTTVEHCMAALSGLEIDNVLIEIDSVETPILDGSAKPYVDLLLQAGVKEQEADKNHFELKEIIKYQDANNPDIELIAIPNDHFEVRTIIDYNSKVLKPQYAHLKDIKDFNEHYAACKTFVFLRELQPLIDMGLVKGGDLENAIVYVDDVLEDEQLNKLKTFFNKPDVKVESEGVLNNIELKYDNEAARHKLLDIVGDLNLVGRPLKAKIIATKPGHKANTELAKLLKKHIEKVEEANKIPHYDVNKAPIYDINDIKRMLPHRPPFLLIDKIIEMGETHVVGVKGVTMNEPFFKGHFPNNPVMPGVLQIEAMAQVGGILVLSTVPDPENYSTLFARIDNVRFRQPVVPGDTLVFKLELTAPVRRGICQMKGLAYVGNKLVVEANLVAQIAKK